MTTGKTALALKTMAAKKRLRVCELAHATGITGPGKREKSCRHTARKGGR